MGAFIVEKRMRVTRAGFFRTVTGGAVAVVLAACDAGVSFVVMRDSTLLDALLENDQAPNARFFEGETTSGWVVSNDPQTVDLKIQVNGKPIVASVKQTKVRVGDRIDVLYV